MPRGVLFILLLLAVGPALRGQETLRGQVFVDLEPVYALSPEVRYPLDAETVRRRALEEASLFFSSMIYGWEFFYEAGERARGLAENLELESLGGLAFGDGRLRVTDARLDGPLFSLWADYHLSDSQRRRMSQWGSGQGRNVQGTGQADLSLPGPANTWILEKQAALKDAARAGIRAMLRGQERNRPKAARGRIALSGFPRFYFDRGKLTVAARFRMELVEVESFAAW